MRQNELKLTLNFAYVMGYYNGQLPEKVNQSMRAVQALGLTTYETMSIVFESYASSIADRVERVRLDMLSYNRDTRKSGVR